MEDVEPAEIACVLKMSLPRIRPKLFLINLFYRKFSTKIAALLLLIASVPIVLSGLLLINASQRALKSSVFNSRKEIVVRAAEEIKLFIKEPQDMLTNTAAQFSILDPDPWKQESILVGLALNQPIFMQITSLDLSGRVIASSELGKKTDYIYPEEVIKNAVERKTYISKVKIFNNHTPYLTMAVAIKKMGRVTGVLMADVNLRGIWHIVDNIKLDRTGRVFLVSNEGILISHWDKKMVLQGENLKDGKDVQLVLAGNTQAIEYQGKTGKKWVSAFAPISDLGWGVVLRQEEQEAYQFSKLMKMQSWLIIILSELLVILASIYTARALAKPIRLMASRFKSVASGDLDKIIESKRHDEIGQLVRYLNHMTEKLREAKDRERLSAIGEASAWITHEFKNSLSSIKSFVQLFPAKHSDKQFVDKFSRLIPEEINRWERMLKELSDFSSSVELRLEKVNLKETINNILYVMEDRFKETKINVKFDCQQNNLYIRADSERLKQVFINLIINAIEAMPQGGQLYITTDLLNSKITCSHPYIKVSIKDTGIGIHEDNLENIFEPFYTSKRGGMGLGLAISRRIIQQHAGNIEVKSQQNKGTEFIITLPHLNYNLNNTRISSLFNETDK